MPAFTTISADKLARLIGRPDCPTLIDVRTEDDFAADPRLVPGSARRSHQDVAGWAGELGTAGRSAVVICQRGAKLSQGVAAWLRHEGVPAETLEGGAAGWASAGLPMVPAERLPPRDGSGRTVWVTRSRPKIDRIACPWLIARFIDQNPEFLYVPAKDVHRVAHETGAVPYDVPDVELTHEGEFCSFDTFLKKYELNDPALRQLAVIVRAADTDRFDLAPQAAGLFAISLGLSANIPDDHEMLKVGMVMYDALYRWCKSGQGETHNWPPAMQ
jgi:rhodanese-related sulfurtransferase